LFVQTFAFERMPDWAPSWLHISKLLLDILFQTQQLTSAKRSKNDCTHNYEITSFDTTTAPWYIKSRNQSSPTSRSLFFSR
jgi:hypothetical protein